MDNHNAVSAAEYAESIINNPLISPNIADGATNIDTYSLSIMTDRNRVHWPRPSIALKRERQQRL